MKPLSHTLQELADLPHYGDAAEIIRRSIDPNWKLPRGDLTEGEGEYCVELNAETKMDAERAFDVVIEDGEVNCAETAMAKAWEQFEDLDIDYEDEVVEAEQSKGDPQRWTVYVSYTGIEEEEEEYNVYAIDRESAFDQAIAEAWEYRRSYDIKFYPIVAYRTDLND